VGAGIVVDRLVIEFHPPANVDYVCMAHRSTATHSPPPTSRRCLGRISHDMVIGTRRIRRFDFGDVH